MFRLQKQPESDIQVEVEKQQDEMKMWLSYWSCWPFLRFLLEVNAQTAPEASKSFIDGVLVAMVLGAKVWNFSLAAPAIIEATGNSLDVLSDALAEAVSSAGKYIMGKAYESNIVGKLKDNIGGIGVVLVLLLTVVAVLAKVFSIASTILLVALLLFVATESASAVAKGDNNLIRQRLCFWIIALVWMTLSYIPLLGIFIYLFTPVMLVISLMFGERIVNMGLNILLRVLACLIQCFITTFEKKQPPGILDAVDRQPLLIVERQEPANVQPIPEAAPDSPGKDVPGSV
jgi:hypothetical protein